MLHAYKVILNGKEIDKVYYAEKQDKDEVKRSLINHDGYNPNIVIVKERSPRITEKGTPCT